MSSNTPGSEKVLLDSPPVRKVPVDWSPDGRHIIYVQFNPETNLDIWVLPLFGDRKPFKFFKETDNEEGDCQFSPDGLFVAYQSNESGIFEIYIRTFPDALGPWQISEGGGIEARWGQDGKELFYIAPDGNMMAVPIQTSEKTVNRGIPTVLFPSGILGGGTPPLHQRQRYDVTPDGQRFLINTADESSVMPIAIVSNWTRLLEK